MFCSHSYHWILKEAISICPLLTVCEDCAWHLWIVDSLNYLPLSWTEMLCSDFADIGGVLRHFFPFFCGMVIPLNAFCVWGRECSVMFSCLFLPWFWIYFCLKHFSFVNSSQSLYPSYYTADTVTGFLVSKMVLVCLFYLSWFLLHSQDCFFCS